MPGKTNKSITKRFKFTKYKSLMHRLSHQDHFNAKESGNKQRKKRKLKKLKGTMAKKIIKMK